MLFSYAAQYPRGDFPHKERKDTMADDNPNAVKLEYDALIKEYESLRAEIVSTLDSARQVTNYALVFMGAALAVLPTLSETLVQSQNATIILIAPAIFYFLPWTALRYAIVSARQGCYINQTIAPSIRRCITRLEPALEQEAQGLFGWEKPGKSVLHTYGLRSLPIAAGHFGLPLFGAVLLLGLYAAFMYSQRLFIQPVDVVLIAINIICLLYSVWWGAKTEQSR
jgi:hypothetical protein